MALLSNAYIDEVLARTDLVEVIGSRVALKRVGREMTSCCPFHKEETPSFTVSPAKQFFHCFGCGKHGNAIQFLMFHDGVSFRDAVSALAQAVSMPQPDTKQADAKDEARASLYSACAFAADHYHREIAAPEVREYLALREIGETSVTAFHLGYASGSWDGLQTALRAHGVTPAVQEAAGLVSRADSGRLYDKFRGRLIFPIHDTRGRAVALAGRIISTSGTPKYLNGPETDLFRKGEHLYGLWQVLQAQKRPSRLIVLEGYLDVVAAHQHGFTAAVATMGTATTDAQVRLAFRYTEDVVFCFDGDRAGLEAAWKALLAVLPHMAQGRQVDFAFLPSGHDPDSILRERGRDGFSQVLSAAVPLSQFLLDRLRDGISLDSIEGKARLAERARPCLKLIPEGAYRSLLWQHVERLTGLRIDDSPTLRAAMRSTPSHVSFRKSDVRTAVTLILHMPSLAADGFGEGIGIYRCLNVPGMELLADLIDACAQSRDLEPQQLLEHFEAHPDHLHLLTLAALPLDLTEEAIWKEFGRVMGRIDEGARRRRIELLHHQDVLSEADQEELRSLLAVFRAPKVRKRRPQRHRSA